MGAHVRIRYYGLMANRNKKINLEKCYEYFELEQRVEEITKDWDRIYFEVTGIDIHKCPVCKKGHMVGLEFLEQNLYHPLPDAWASRKHASDQPPAKLA